ncbi:UNVERIFIED_CONTAM: hypothetical protein FKN15_027846 [Acipenser sinensis]
MGNTGRFFGFRGDHPDHWTMREEGPQQTGCGSPGGRAVAQTTPEVLTEVGSVAICQGLPTGLKTVRPPRVLELRFTGPFGSPLPPVTLGPWALRCAGSKRPWVGPGEWRLAHDIQWGTVQSPCRHQCYHHAHLAWTVIILGGSQRSFVGSDRGDQKGWRGYDKKGSRAKRRVEFAELHKLTLVQLVRFGDAQVEEVVRVRDKSEVTGMKARRENWREKGQQTKGNQRRQIDSMTRSSKGEKHPRLVMGMSAQEGGAQVSSATTASIASTRVPSSIASAATGASSTQEGGAQVSSATTASIASTRVPSSIASAATGASSTQEGGAQVSSTTTASITSTSVPSSITSAVTGVPHTPATRKEGSWDDYLHIVPCLREKWALHNELPPPGGERGGMAGVPMSPASECSALPLPEPECPAVSPAQESPALPP